MAKASPIQTSYNGGEVSPLIRGRVDTERFKASMELCENFIPLVQGPLQKRPGTKYIANVINDTVSSRLIPFTFSSTQTYMIELGNLKLRIYKDKALVLTGSPATITGATQANPCVITTSAAHGYVAGDSVYITGVTGMTSLNNRIFTVANETSTTFELSGVDSSAYPSYSASGTATEVYERAHPFASADLDEVQFTQSADTLYLFHEDYQPRKLVRNSDTDWDLTTLDLEDGPYLEKNTTSTTLKPASTGHATAQMTSNTAPVGTVASTPVSTLAYYTFDRDINNDLDYGLPPVTVDFTFAASAVKVVDAYSITAPDTQTEANWSASSWTIEGYDGADWVVLDQKNNESGWAAGEKRFYAFDNKTAYNKYRWNITATNAPTGSTVSIGELEYHQAATDQTAFNLTASAVTGINDDTGFQSTDVGRAIRLLGSDGKWRWAKITEHTSTTVVKIQLYGFALPDTSPITTWKLGRYSDTSGWPSAGIFFEDRLVLSGPGAEYYASNVSDYPNHAETNEEDTTDDSTAIAVPNLLSRQVNKVYWAATDYRSLLLGTSGGEWVARSASSSEPFSATNIQTRVATHRGSTRHRPIQIENATLFIAADGRSLHELAYLFEVDGYKSPNLSWIAEHITASSDISEMDYAKSPQTILWIVREDGQLVGLTYERDQNTLAFHRHPIADGNCLVERVAAIEGADGTSDVYLVLKKGSQRFVCTLDALWVTSNTISDAYFVDAGVYYDSTPATTIGDLWHLEGETVTGTADGESFTATVANGVITLGASASKVSAGLQYTSKMQSMPVNAGATDGTSQGKTKRIHQVVFRVLNSRGGKYAYDQNSATTYSFNFSQTVSRNFTTSSNLTTGDAVVRWPAEYGYDGVVYIEHDDPYPFTLVAHMPQVLTQDRG